MLLLICYIIIEIYDLEGSKMKKQLFRFCAAVIAFACVLNAEGCSVIQAGESAPPSSEPSLSSSEPLSSSQADSEPMAAEPVRVNLYGVETDAYQAEVINGKAFFSVEEAAGIFDIPISYDEASKTVSIGDTDSAYPDVAIPELTMFPSVALVTGLPARSVRTNGSVVEYESLTQGVPFEEILPQLGALFEQDGFAVPDEAAFSDFLSSHEEFAKGSRENTWFRYTNGEGTEPDAAQILDGGMDENQIPIVTIRFFPASQTRSKASEPIAGMEQGKILRYGEECQETAYLLNGVAYVAAEDTLTLFGKRSVYSEEDAAVSVGQTDREDISVYVPDISVLPSLSGLFDSAAAELYIEATGIVLWYPAGFEAELPSIAQQLTEQGYAPASAEEFEALAEKSRAFSEGTQEYTWLFTPADGEEPIGIQLSPSQTSQGEEAVAVKISV